MHALVFSNLFIALAAAALALGTAPLLGLEFDSPALALLVFSATLLVYNLDRLIGGRREDRIASSPRHLWIRNHRHLLWAIAALATLGVLISIPFLHPATTAIIIPLGLLSLAYAVPLGFQSDADDRAAPPTKRGRRLKELPALKTLSIALVWAAVTVLLPVLEAGESIWNPAVLLVFLERLVFVYALTIPFDGRDLHRDRISRIPTVVVLLGRPLAMALALGLMALFIASTTLQFALYSDGTYLALMLSGWLTLAAIIPAYHKQIRAETLPELYYGGLLDGMLLIQGLLLLAL